MKQGLQLRTSQHLALTPQLQQSIRTAGDAIITVRARDFWQQPSIPAAATHNVYVSGMEVSASGKVLGYYVNDTGSGEADRYVSAALLNASWTRSLVQMLPNPSKPPPRSSGSNLIHTSANWPEPPVCFLWV